LYALYKVGTNETEFEKAEKPGMFDLKVGIILLDFPEQWSSCGASVPERSNATPNMIC